MLIAQCAQWEGQHQLKELNPFLNVVTKHNTQDIENECTILEFQLQPYILPTFLKTL